MMRRPSLFALFVLGLTIGFSHGANKTTTNKTSFKDVVDAHFDSWAKGGNGKLTSARVDALVSHREIKGEEAAAIASIHLYFRSHKTASGLSKTELLALAGQKTEEERRDLTAKKAHLSSNFQTFQHHLSVVPHQVFATEPQRVGMSQGDLGDCYVVSAIGAAVTLRAKQVHTMIHPNADGSCDVFLPGAGRVHVPALTDAQIVLGSKAGQQGIWLNVMEEAFGEVSAAHNRARGKPAVAPGVAIDAISHGGDVAHSIELLSGKAGHTWTIRKDKGAEHPPVGAEYNKMVAEVRQLLHMTVGHKLVCCSVSSKGKYPPGIITDHAYAIIGFDGKDKVTVWNPWGQHFTPKGTPGMANGFEIQNGEFTLTVEEFVQIFEDISYETDKPAGKR